LQTRQDQTFLDRHRGEHIGRRPGPGGLSCHRITA
jgi:hypothetical protein